MISQNLFSNQAHFALAHIVLSLVCSSPHHFNFLETGVVICDFSLEKAFSYLATTECQLLLEKTEVSGKK